MAGNATKKRAAQGNRPDGPADTTTVTRTLENPTNNKSYNKFDALHSDVLGNDEDDDTRPDLPDKDSEQWAEMFPDITSDNPTQKSHQASYTPRFPRSAPTGNLELATQELRRTLQPHKDVTSDYDVVKNRSRPAAWTKEEREQKYQEHKRSKAEGLDWNEDWEYCLDKRPQSPPRELQIPENSTRINGKDKKEVSRNDVQQSAVWKKFLETNWRKTRNPNVKVNSMNHGLCLGRNGALLDPGNAEIFISKGAGFPAPEGVREPMTGPAQAQPPEEEVKRPNNYMKQAVPWSNVWHPREFGELTPMQKEDPEILLDQLKRATHAGSDSIATYKDLTWKLNRAATVSKNTVLQNQKLAAQVEELEVALAEMQVDRDDLSNQVKYLKETASVRGRLESLDETQKDLAELLSANAKHLAELRKDGQAEKPCIDYTEKLIEAAKVSEELDLAHRIVRTDDILKEAMNGAKRTFKADITKTKNNLKNNLADKRVYNIAYRNGLIEGALAARTGSEQDQLIAVEKQIKEETELILNYHFQEESKDKIERSYNRGEQRGTALGLALGMNVMYRQATGDTTYSEQFKEAGEFVGSTARRVYDYAQEEMSGDGQWVPCLKPGNEWSIVAEDDVVAEPTALDEFFANVKVGWHGKPPEPYSSLEIPYYEAQMPWDLQGAQDAVDKNDSDLRHTRPKPAKVDHLYQHGHDGQATLKEDDPWNFNTLQYQDHWKPPKPSNFDSENANP